MRLFVTGITLLIIFLTVASGHNGQAAAPFRPTGEMKVQVTFGDSYHHYLPGGSMRMGVTFKNNGAEKVEVSQVLMVIDTAGVSVWDTVINLQLASNQSCRIPLIVPVPKFSGRFTLTLPQDTSFQNSSLPVFDFEVIKPEKSSRLSKILVHTPDWEEGLNSFLKTWNIKAPTISWGQVLLCGKKSTAKFVAGDDEMVQMINRALKREMSVIFLDFGPSENEQITKMTLPYNISLSFVKMKSPEQSFVLKSDHKELTYGLRSDLMSAWNGNYGVSVPATDLRFDGKGVKINAFATSGKKPFRFPLVELIPQNGKGKIYLCQLMTAGRLDEAVEPLRNHPELPAYDPMAVQFLLNLISASVGDNLLK